MIWIGSYTVCWLVKDITMSNDSSYSCANFNNLRVGYLLNKNYKFSVWDEDLAVEKRIFSNYLEHSREPLHCLLLPLSQFVHTTFQWSRVVDVTWHAINTCSLWWFFLFVRTSNTGAFYVVFVWPQMNDNMTMAKECIFSLKRRSKSSSPPILHPDETVTTIGRRRTKDNNKKTYNSLLNVYFLHCQ